jgi:flagellar hook-length control protein FliK
LYPADLGRVEVRLEWADDGALRAVISAERSETLDLLQRDSRALDRALQDAGLKTDSGSLSFDLRGHAENRDESAHTQSRTGELSGQKATNDDATDADADTSLRKREHDGILDLSV